MATLEGSRELASALRALPAQVERTALRKSAAAGARVVRDQVKQFAPVGRYIKRTRGRLIAPGTLKRAVTMKYAKEKSGPGASTYVVTLRRGGRAQKQGRDAYYWIWVERGHRVVGRSGRVIGQAPAHPFFVPAYRGSSVRALEAMRATLESEVAAIVKAT